MAGVLHNPYSIQRNSYTPRLPRVKVVYCQDFSDIRTCQNPDFRSILEKNRAPTMDSMVSCMQGRGNESFLVLEFNFRKSIQNRKVPSFFCTRTMALHQGDLDSWIAPLSRMSCRFSRTSSSRDGAICWNCSLKGMPSINSMMCSAMSVQPISFLSSRKMWWCSINICLNFRACSGDHSFNYSSPPPCRNSSIRSFCHSSIVSFGDSFGRVSSRALASTGEGTALGTYLATVTLATHLPGAKCIILLVRFWRTTDTFQLPSFSSV